MEAVFNRVNEAGGVHGRKIKLIAYDHVYQPPKAVANAKRLVERDKVFIMMGHLGTPTTKAIKDYLEEKHVPNVFPATLASLWTNSGKWHIADLATFADQTRLIVDYLVNERKFTKIASFYQDDEYGLDGHVAGRVRLRELGKEYAAEVDYKRADIDFSSQAAKLKESGAEAVILQAVYREPPRLAEQCHAIGYNPVFIGVSAIVLDKTIELGGKHVEAMIGVEVYPDPNDPGPFLDQYRADMKKYFPSLALDTTNLYGYQKAALFVEALQRTGRNLTHDTLLQAITTIKDWDPGWGLKYSYGGDNRRGMSRSARMVVVKDGKWTKMTDWFELEEMRRQ
jgi:branched-chain amino acid transport system substrate-binding protein